MTGHSASGASTGPPKGASPGSSDAPSAGALRRQLGLADAVLIGLGSMIGAGIFAVFGPAAAAAGSALLIGLGIAAVIAYCNAAASAQLAAVYPTSGGTYIYGRERLGHWWGFVAGWGFVVGKAASCAAMALTFARYAVPNGSLSQRAVAVVAVIALAALNYRGVTRTATLTRILASFTIAALLVLVGALWLGGGTSIGTWSGWSSFAPGGLHGIVQAAGLLFFAFAGYARIATMGEEVRDPARIIPKAILRALTIALGLYVVVALSVLAAAGPDRLAASPAPLVTALEAAGSGALAPVVRIAAAIASLGALLALIAGIGRTSLAMARHGDLPSWLAAVHPRFHVPHHGEVALAAVVCAVVMIGDIRDVIGFSSFGVLVYYAVANTAAFTQPAAQRRYPRFLNVVGGLGCLILAASLPASSILAGVAVFAVGLAGRWLVRRLYDAAERSAGSTSEA